MHIPNLMAVHIVIIYSYTNFRVYKKAHYNVFYLAKRRILNKNDQKKDFVSHMDFQYISIKQ